MISATAFLDFLYNARLKFQRYEESMLLEAARQEGIQEGRQEGVIVGSVPVTNDGDRHHDRQAP